MASMTVGYSDSEDRLWVRLVGDDAEQRVWLTRRTTLALVQALAQRLEASLAELDSIVQIDAAQRLALEQDEAAGAMGASAPGPASKSADYRVTDSGLCTVFDLQTQDERWLLRLHNVGDNPLEFSGNRLQIHQFLKSLLNRQREADWRLPAPQWLTGTVKV